MILQNTTIKLDEKKNWLALDSNVFRNLDFINFLTLKKLELHIFMPTIVQLEVGYYYKARGITWEAFKKDVQKFGGIFIQWDNKLIPEAIRFAFIEKKHLPFKKHFRDFLIGVECKNIPAPLITYNKSHFTWLKDINIYTPEEYLHK